MLPKQPSIVGAVADSDTLAALPELGKTTDLCDFIEFRIDALLEQESLLEQRIAGLNKPLVITVRDPTEGGLNDLSANERSKRMLQFLPHTSILDIEIRNLPAFQSVTTAAQGNSISVLGSYHDFEATPSRCSLPSIEAARLEPTRSRSPSRRETQWISTRFLPSLKNNHHWDRCASWGWALWE